MIGTQVSLDLGQDQQNVSAAVTPCDYGVHVLCCQDCPCSCHDDPWGSAAAGQRHEHHLPSGGAR